MSTDKANIQQIQKYLKGELDAKAMHRLERQAQDDPFLMDAIEGYQNTGTDQQANFDDVKQRFAKRQQKRNNTPFTLWQTVGIAATLLVVLVVGLLMLKPKKQAEVAFSKSIVPPNVSAPAAPALARSAQTDANHIAGIITDATGHALANAKVSIKGTGLITRTDSTGRFNLASAPAGTLNVTAYGYDKKQISLQGKNNINVVLNESTNQLASVSVTAYVEDDKPANKTHPVIGWKAFRDYLRKNAFVESGETGLVKLAFTVDTVGNIKGIRIIKGKNVAMNQKAVALIMNGPDWKGITAGETRLKILFRRTKSSS